MFSQIKNLLELLGVLIFHVMKVQLVARFNSNSYLFILFIYLLFIVHVCLFMLNCLLCDQIK